MVWFAAAPPASGAPSDTSQGGAIASRENQVRVWQEIVCAFRQADKLGHCAHAGSIPPACAAGGIAASDAGQARDHRRIAMLPGFGISGLALLIIILLVSSFRVLREYERGVTFMLGRFWKVKGPGLVLVIPVIQQMVRVDLRTIVHDVPTQDVISRDNVSVKVNAVLYFRVVDPEKAIIHVANFFEATSQLAQTTLRSVLGKHELDEMLAERERLNIDIQQVLDAQTDTWGIKVSNVEIKHVDLDESMIRAIARQAEAERERRAKVIHAEGELQASQKLTQAAEVLARQQGAMQLRYLQTLGAIAGDRSSTIVFPLPIELLTGVVELSGKNKTAG
jgi:regulator of protease activity HflC (stomatin/prohibitin superfamily)